MGMRRQAGKDARPTENQRLDDIFTGLAVCRRQKVTFVRPGDLS